MKVSMLVMNNLQGDARVERAASALAEAGHIVTVFGVSGEGLADFEERDGWRLRRVVEPGTATWRHPVRKLREMGIRSAGLAAAAVAEQADVIHAHDADTLRAAFRAARTIGAAVLCDAGELYPEMIASNRVNTPWPVLAYWSWVERRNLPRCDAVITVGDAIAAEFHSRYGVRPIIVRSVPSLEPVGDRSALRNHLGLSADRIIVLYQGLINRGRGIEQVIDALGSVPQADLVLQGMGPCLDEYLGYAKVRDVAERVHYTGYVPFIELGGWASGADIGLVLIENTSVNNYLSSPNKLYQYLMAGIPLLGSDFPEIARVIRDEGRCGVVCNPASSEDVARALSQLVSATCHERAEMGARARELAETRYNWDSEKMKLLAVYDRFAAGSLSREPWP